MRNATNPASGRKSDVCAGSDTDLPTGRQLDLSTSREDHLFAPREVDMPTSRKVDFSTSAQDDRSAGREAALSTPPQVYASFTTAPRFDSGQDRRPAHAHPRPDRSGFRRARTLEPALPIMCLPKERDGSTAAVFCRHAAAIRPNRDRAKHPGVVPSCRQGPLSTSTAHLWSAP